MRQGWERTTPSLGTQRELNKRWLFLPHIVVAILVLAPPLLGPPGRPELT